MQGKRTDQKYPRIVSHIAKKQPMPACDLHRYLGTYHDIGSSSNRSHLITRLCRLGFITRDGKPGSNKYTFSACS